MSSLSGAEAFISFFLFFSEKMPYTLVLDSLFGRFLARPYGVSIKAITTRQDSRPRQLQLSNATRCCADWRPATSDSAILNVVVEESEIERKGERERLSIHNSSTPTIWSPRLIHLRVPRSFYMRSLAYSFCSKK